MASLRTLSSKERKKVLEKLHEQFGCDTEFLKKYVWLFKEQKAKYYIATEDVLALDLAALPVETLGLYVCSELKNGEMRLSIEGSQLIGPSCTKNILELDDGEFKLWIRGHDIEKETALTGFLVVKHRDDFVGSGKPVLDEKTGRILVHNYIPKTRYVRSED